MIRKLLITAVLVSLTLPVRAWFITEGQTGKRVYITRVNEFETGSLSNAPAGYDLGDTNAAIVARLGGGLVAASNAFVCAWPVTINTYFAVNPGNNRFGPYTSATLEYHVGTNTTTDTNWITIATLQSNQFQAVQGVAGAHFGVVTWTPPNVSNAVYLVRIYAEVGNGLAVSADRTALNITPNGDGVTWTDSEIVAIKVIPHKRPGFE